MIRILLKSKIHRATVTEADLDYEGSVTVDADLLEAANIVEHEQVQIYNITTGTRLTTYAVVGSAGSGEIRINGAAAHLVRPGDLVIIASYAHYNQADAARHVPRVLLVDRKNRIVSTKGRAVSEPNSALAAPSTSSGAAANDKFRSTSIRA